jgi:hypothetical protein
VSLDKPRYLGELQCIGGGDNGLQLAGRASHATVPTDSKDPVDPGPGTPCE